MPFKSKAQRNFMFAKHPKTAKKWSEKYGVDDKLLGKKAKDRKKYGIGNLKGKKYVI